MNSDAISDDATGSVLAWGYADLSSQLQAGQTLAAIPDGVTPLDNVELYYQLWSGAAFVEMTAPQKSAVDNARRAQERATAARGVRGIETYPTAAELPLPPPDADILVVVQDAGAGEPALALSTVDRWYLFAPATVAGP